MTLREQADAVKSRQDFIAFVGELVMDLEENPKAWENPRLDDFLGAMARWTADLDSLPAKERPDPRGTPWYLLARALLAARSHE